LSLSFVFINILALFPDFAGDKWRSPEVEESAITFWPAVRRLRSAIGVQILDNDLPTCPSAYLPLFLHSSTSRLQKLEAGTTGGNY
jgi:hypothetical protein